MNQQRSRRFRSAQEAKEKDEEKKEFLTLLARQNGGSVMDAVQEGLEKKTWDSNAITPGTPFMDILAASLRYWCAYKHNNDPMWANLKVIISDATVPGEGEHKIMEFIRSQRSSPQHNPNTRHVIYGLDADLIMLGLATHEPHFRVLREDVFFQQNKGRGCRICGQEGHFAAECRGEVKKKEGEFDEKSKNATEKPFIWLHVSILREYLAIEMDPPGVDFQFDLERALDDWVFMCFFVGNDFLPHLPSLDIREQGIDTLIAIWRDNLKVMGGYLTKDGHIDLERCQVILNGLAKQEDAIFKRRKETDDRREAGNKRREREQEARNGSRNGGRGSGRNGEPPSTRRKFNQETALPPSAAEMMGTSSGNNFSTPVKPGNGITHDMVVNPNGAQDANAANKSAAAVLKEKLLGNKSTDSLTNGPAVDASPVANSDFTSTPPSTLGKRKASEIDQEQPSTPGRKSPIPNGTITKPDPEAPPPDEVRLWEDGYADRYYESKFHVAPDDREFRHKVGRAYVEGLAWVLLYYFQGCPSWTWYYPYHYAPFAADFTSLKDVTIDFKKGQPFKPYEQLMGVLPAASNHAIPEAFHPLMTDDDSDIKDFYPEDFHVDLNGKKFAWQGVAILPFIDEHRLLKAMNTKYPLLSDEEKERNDLGRDVLSFSDKHPLHANVMEAFYSKSQGSPKVSLDSKISQGLAGKIEKDEDFLPSGSLIFPGDSGAMPDIPEDRSISVHYDFPTSTHLHKSMLMRGVEMPKRILNDEDIAETRNQASRTGRSYGGAPLRGNGRGGRGGGYRGGRMDYTANAPPPQHDSYNTNNPFAAHINPRYLPQNGAPPPPPPGWGAPYPPPQMPGPYGNQYGQMPPMPPQGGYNGGYSGGYGGQGGYPQYPQDPRYGYGGPPARGGQGYRGNYR